MRRAFLLVEMLAILAGLTAMLVIVGRLYRTTLYEIPVAYRKLQSHCMMLDLLSRIRRDISLAKGVTLFHTTSDANQDALAIELSDSRVCYEFDDASVVRLARVDDRAGNLEPTASWNIPRLGLKWQIWKRDGEPYAVEFQTYVSQRSGSIIDKKLANSHIFFIGAHPEAFYAAQND